MSFKVALLLFLLVAFARSSSLNAQIRIESVDSIQDANGPVTVIKVSLVGGTSSSAKLNLSYPGRIADLRTGQTLPLKNLIFSDKNRTVLAFNIRYGIGVFSSYAIIQENGSLSVISDIGDKAWAMYLLKHKGTEGSSTLAERIHARTLYFVHLNSQNQDDPWIHFSAKMDEQGNLTLGE